MKKIWIALMLITSILFTNTIAFAAADTKFTDIKGHWAENSIEKVVDKETFADKDCKFQPNKLITRSEFVMMLYKALDIHIEYFKAPDVKDYFDDVKNEDVYASALIDLVTTNVIDDKGHFYPSRALTREEMVHYIMNAYKYKMSDNYKMIKLAPKPFADNKKINPVYSGEITRAEYMGLTVRPVSKMFYPKHAATRAQAAVMIERLLRQVEKENLKVEITPSAEQKNGTLNMKLTITNHSKTKVVFTHSSGYKYDFKLFDSKGNDIYTWSADKMFTMALVTTVVEPNQTIEFSAEVEKAVWDNIKTKAVSMKAYLIGKVDGFTTNPDGYEIEIK